MAKPLLVLLKNNSDLTLWEEDGDKAFKTFKEMLMNLPDLGHPNYQTPFSFLFMKRK